MADSFPSPADLAAEEEELQFTGFTNDDAWDVGSALVAAARRDGAPVAVDVSRHGHQLFHASLWRTTAWWSPPSGRIWAGDRRPAAAVPRPAGPGAADLGASPAGRAGRQGRPRRGAGLAGGGAAAPRPGPAVPVLRRW